jgi:hypothetical protein
MEYFYPIRDREQMAKNAGRLGSKIIKFDSAITQLTSASQLKEELVRLKK